LIAKVKEKYGLTVPDANISFTLSRDYDDLLYNTLVSKFGERVDIEFLDQNKSINSWTPVSEIAPYTLPEKGKKPTTVLIHVCFYDYIYLPSSLRKMKWISIQKS